MSDRDNVDKEELEAILSEYAAETAAEQEEPEEYIPAEKPVKPARSERGADEYELVTEGLEDSDENYASRDAAARAEFDIGDYSCDTYDQAMQDEIAAFVVSELGSDGEDEDTAAYEPEYEYEAEREPEYETEYEPEYEQEYEYEDGYEDEDSEPYELLYGDEYEDEYEDEYADEGPEEYEEPYGDSEPEAELEAEPDDYEVTEIPDEGEYAELSEDFEPPEEPKQRKESALTHFAIAALAAITTMRRKRMPAGNAAPARADESASETAGAAAPDIGNTYDGRAEMSLKQAARFYSAYSRPTRLRFLLSGAVCVLMVAICCAYELGWPLPRGMSGNLPVVSLLCLIMLLTVMLSGLDVFSAGLFSLAKGAPGAGSLVSVSCVVSALDAVSAAAGVHPALPFCVVSAVSLALAQLGSLYNCRAYYVTYRTAAEKDDFYVLSAEASAEGMLLKKSRRGSGDFVGRSEESSPGEEIYDFAAPFLFVAALILLVSAAISYGKPAAALHIAAALFSVCASFAGLLASPKLFSEAAYRAGNSRAAIAGYAGAADIAAAKRAVISDNDLFPPETLSFGDIRTQPNTGLSAETVISYTASVMAAAGSGLAPLFMGFCLSNGFSLHPVKEFASHEAGGFIALIGPDSVQVGSMGFMTLHGIRLTGTAAGNTAVYTAVNNTLVGIFDVKYKGAPQIRQALNTLLAGKIKPYFAFRDFNINPQLIQETLSVATDGSDFPPHRERFGVSADSVSGQTSAIFAAEGLSPLSAVLASAQKLFNYSRFCALFSVAFSALALVIMFLICRSGSLDALSVVRTLVLMSVPLVPVFLLAYGIRTQE